MRLNVSGSYNLPSRMEKFEGQYNVLKITVDKNPMISNHYRIQGVAALMTCVNGDDYKRNVGSQTDE